MIVSSMAWGLGYFGQPHILVRFMSIKSVDKLGKSMTIAIIWVLLSLSGAVFVGFIGSESRYMIILAAGRRKKFSSI